MVFLEGSHQLIVIRDTHTAAHNLEPELLVCGFEAADDTLTSPTVGTHKLFHVSLIPSKLVLTDDLLDTLRQTRIVGVLFHVKSL